MASGGVFLLARLCIIALGGCVALVACEAPRAAAERPAEVAPQPASPAGTDLEARKQRVLRLGDPSHMDSDRAKMRSYDILAATALKGCGPPEWASYMVSIPGLPPDEGPEVAVEPIEMFALPPLVRYVYQFGNCLSADQKSDLLRRLSVKQRLTGGGTTNHAIMRASSWYLLAQYYPDAHWTDWDGKQYSSQQLMSILARRLAARTARFYESGHTEWMSPTYAMVNIYPVLNLVDFASDPKVRQLASDEASLEVSVMRTQSFHGVLVPPLTRKNYEQRNAPDKPGTYIPSPSQQVLWYYFGDPQMSDFDLQSRKDPYFVTMLALSKWLPPAGLGSLGGDSALSYPVRSVTPSFGDWGQPTVPAIYGDSYVSPNFAIGTGNLVFDPGDYNDHTQTFAILLKSNAPSNAIECFQPYWSSNKGEDYWSTDRSSPFQQMVRYDDTSVAMLFDIPKQDPWTYDSRNRFYATRNNRANSLYQMFECRIPQSVDMIITERQWVFVKQGGVFVAIATLAGTNEYDNVPPALSKQYLVFKVREAKSALFFRVEDAGAGMDFNQFQANVRKKVPRYDKDSSSVTVTDSAGQQQQIAFQLKQQSPKLWASVPAVSSVDTSKAPRMAAKAAVMAVAPDGGAAPAAFDSPVLRLSGGALSLKAGKESIQLSPGATSR